MLNESIKLDEDTTMTLRRGMLEICQVLGKEDSLVYLTLPAVMNLSPRLTTIVAALEQNAKDKRIRDREALKQQIAELQAKLEALG